MLFVRSDASRFVARSAFANLASITVADDAADEFGILIQHDLQFAVSNVDLREINHELYNYSARYQNMTRIMEEETRYQVRRLSHHPSVAVYTGCNECMGHGLGELNDTDWPRHVVPIQTAVEVDRSRAVMPSCPSYGWSGGVDRLWGRPNGRPLVVQSTAGPPPNRSAYPYPLESHGPYVGLGGNGWPALNHWSGISTAGMEMAASNTLPPTFGRPLETGCDQTGHFVSEFGCVAFSSFESMSAQLPPDQWSVHSAAFFYRNWPVDNVSRPSRALLLQTLKARLCLRR